MVGDNHLLHHAWVLIALGLGESIVFLVPACVLLVVLNYLGVRDLPMKFAKRAAVVALLFLPLILAIDQVFVQSTLFSKARMELLMAEKFEGLIKSHAPHPEKITSELSAAKSDKEKLRVLSRHIIENNLLKRDLVITGSSLSQTSSQLRPDLYFYAATGMTKPTYTPDRSISFLDLTHDWYRTMLLDVVIGSGSIYPFFPSRVLDNFPEKNDRYELIDGGFAHNSPVDAAVEWGATHIIVIEASPVEERRPGSLGTNAVAAFNHLYYEAQSVDARSKERILVFTLKPRQSQNPDLDLLDFTPGLIRGGIAKGYLEARSGMMNGIGHPLFEKGLGLPHFRDAAAIVAAKAAGARPPN